MNISKIRRSNVALTHELGMGEIKILPDILRRLKLDRIND